jgi:hypothetical protein
MSLAERMRLFVSGLGKFFKDATFDQLIGKENI